MANKVKFGLKNVHVWAIESETADKVTYAKPFRVEGAVSLSLKASGDSNPFYADDIIYWNQFSNNGYTGDLEIALIPDQFEVDILGAIKDQNGAIIETANAKPKAYAMAFEFSGDKEETRHILYNCTSSRPNIEGDTKEEKLKPNTDKLNITAAPAKDTGYVKARLSKEQKGYNEFFTVPYIPVTEQPQPPKEG